jgi:hypothetical protein
MQLGESSRWYAPQAAVRPDFVVVRAPERCGRAGLVQGLEPALVQVLNAELAVEAFDEAALHRVPRLDQNVPDAVGLRPPNESSAGDLRANGSRQPYRPLHTLKQSLTKRNLHRVDVCFLPETVHWGCGDQLPQSLRS